ncbi:MAG: alginate lyase family protein [Desulfobulbaceae bacterium]|nr:alginate lyase family protein [Desulfobulbaceae bacterium]
MRNPFSILRHLWPRKNVAPPATSATFAAELRGIKTSAEDWLSSMARKSPLYVDISEESLLLLRQLFPGFVEGTLRTAERIVAHEFRMLGSDIFVPYDQERSIGTDGYRPIDWYLDPVRNLRFPTGIHHKAWELYSMRPGNADIKLPWELARCQHFVTLGQAYRFSHDIKYPVEIINEIDDFMEANPVGFGVNWTCTMDVAIRAANWAFGLALVRAAAGVPTERWRGAYEALFDHGVFIFANFENHYEVTSNHYLSNIVGLYLLATVFSDLPEARQWREFCHRSLEKEITVQILEDGADFESSVPYHRLVLELFMGAARQATLLNEPFSEQYHAVLRKMASFSFDSLRPDGLLPVIGDADDGRLHIFTDYGNWNPQGGQQILGPAAFLLNERTWLRYAGEEGVWEAAWWGYEVGDVSSRNEIPPPTCKLYPQAGLVFFRDESAYLAISNGIVGTQGFGNHKHNDQLSFEFHLNGAPLVVDPGSYVYTSDPAARNLFRSTGYHNTLRVEGQEQNEMNPEWLFRLFETSKAEHLYFRETDQFVEYGGRHVGYQRFSNALEHRRGFRYLKHENLLIVVDCLLGTGEHRLEWHFHLDSKVDAVAEKAGLCRLQNKSGAFFFLYPEQFKLLINKGFVSPSYGVRVPSQTIDLSASSSSLGHGKCMFILGQWESREFACSEDVLRQQQSIVRELMK